MHILKIYYVYYTRITEYLGFFQDAGTCCFGYRNYDSTYQFYLFFVRLCIFWMFVHVYILIILMFLTLLCIKFMQPHTKCLLFEYLALLQQVSFVQKWLI